VYIILHAIYEVFTVIPLVKTNNIMLDN